MVSYASTEILKKAAASKPKCPQGIPQWPDNIQFAKMKVASKHE
jgi:hypothetical protein